MKKQKAPVYCPNCFAELHGEATLKWDRSMMDVLAVVNAAIENGCLNIKLVKNRRKLERL